MTRRSPGDRLLRLDLVHPRQLSPSSKAPEGSTICSPVWTASNVVPSGRRKVAANGTSMSTLEERGAGATVTVNPMTSAPTCSWLKTL